MDEHLLDGHLACGRPLISDDTEVLAQLAMSVDLFASQRLAAALGYPLPSPLSDLSAHAEVVVEEQATAGPGATVPVPFFALALKWRNVETLRRLAFIAEFSHEALDPLSITREVALDACTDVAGTAVRLGRDRP